MYRKKILITGASSGIGYATSLKLIEHGYAVHGISRSQSIQNPHYTHSSIDLANSKTLPEDLQTLRSQIPQLHALVCNAGKGLFGHLEEFSYAQIQSLVELNFLSHVYLIKTFLPLFKTQESGDIILMGSEAAIQGKKEGSLYCATKFALRGFAQALRDECRNKNIRVSLINPGFVKTDFFENLHFSPGDNFSEHILPEDVASVILSILEMRPGTVLDEITLSPQKNKIVKSKTRSNFL